MHLQMADMMKKMGQGKGLFGKMFGGSGAPDAAELERMQAELGKLDPNAIPPELRGMLPPAGAPSPAQLPAGLPGLGGGRLPGFGGLPGLGGSPFKGFAGLPGKKK
jgi:signal recognition particle subunit SRP54